MSGWLKLQNDGVELKVRLTPKASFDRIEPLTDGSAAFIQARVRAVPEDGRANAVLETLVAELANVGKRSVLVTAGQKSRIKTVKITGDPAKLEPILRSRLGV